MISFFRFKRVIKNNVCHCESDAGGEYYHLDVLQVNFNLFKSVFFANGPSSFVTAISLMSVVTTDHFFHVFGEV